MGINLIEEIVICKAMLKFKSFSGFDQDFIKVMLLTYVSFRYFNFKFLLGYAYLHTIYKRCVISGSYFRYIVVCMYLAYM